MSDLFKDKTTMDPFDGVQMASMPMAKPSLSVRSAQTLSEGMATKRADDAMSTEHVSRPRYGRSM